MASSDNKIIGEGISRIDGILKVTGTANYATDWPIKNIAYGYIIKSTIAAGTMTDIDTAAAEKSPGVIAVITYKNAPKVSASGNLREVHVLQDPKVEYFGQHIGIIVAETYEQARFAASTVKVTYDKAEPKVDFEKQIGKAVVPRNRADAVRGDFAAAFQSAGHKIDATYDTPVYHHNPMEPHSTIAVWEGDKLTLYNGSQIVGRRPGQWPGFRP